MINQAIRTYMGGDVTIITKSGKQYFGKLTGFTFECPVLEYNRDGFNQHVIIDPSEIESISRQVA